MPTSFPSGYHPSEQEINRRVLKSAEEHGRNVYLVGGYIRDALCGRYSEQRQPHDFDYAVSGGSAIQFAEILSAELSGHYVLLDEACDTARVVLDNGVMLDFAACVGGTLESDLLRRDFTFNALAWDPQSPDAVIDRVGGLADLKSHTVRAIADSNFDDDPLRLLRAFRFAATFGGTIEAKTLETIKQRSHNLPMVAPERISYELFMIASSPASAPVFKAMGESEILEAIFPELTDTRKVTTNAFHHLGLWDHTLLVMEGCETIAARLPEWCQKGLNTELSAGVSRQAATKIAGLLHDIGKPDTWEITPEGRHSFYGHDRVGADMTSEIADRLRWSRPVARFIINLVRWHLRPGQLFHQGQPTDRAVHRFYRTMSAEMPELMLLAFADLEATRGPGIEGAQHDRLEKSLNELLDGYPVFKEGEQSRIRLLNGNQVMTLLDLEPGPILGEILQALDEAQALNEVSNRAEAEQFVRDCYKQKYRE